MDMLNSPRVLDRAPVLLPSPGNFHDVRQQPIGIRAVHAIQTLECIQITQFVPVDGHVIHAPRLRYAIDGKTNGLVGGNKEIEQRKRNDAGVNKWRRQDHEESRLQHVAEKRSLQPPVLPLDFLGEPDLALAQFVELRLDFVLQFLEIRKREEGVGFLRVMISHIHLAQTGSKCERQGKKKGGLESEPALCIALNPIRGRNYAARYCFLGAGAALALALDLALAFISTRIPSIGLSDRFSGLWTVASFQAG